MGLAVGLPAWGEDRGGPDGADRDGGGEGGADFGQAGGTVVFGASVGVSRCGVGGAGSGCGGRSVLDCVLRVGGRAAALRRQRAGRAKVQGELGYLCDAEALRVSLALAES